jgi:hemerythrin superfamily protein
MKEGRSPMTASSNFTIVQLVEGDHQEVEELLMGFDTTPRADRAGYYCALVEELVQHEVAEEEVLYPALRDEVPGGEAQANARMCEQAGGERLLSELESMDATSRQFEDGFVQLRAVFRRHAELEEFGALSLLVAAVSIDRLVELGNAYVRAKSVAASYPGPVAGYVDRVRDAVRHAA